MGLRVCSGIHSSNQRNIKRRCYRALFIIIAAIVGLLLLSFIQNATVEVNRFTIESRRLPMEFNGYRIAQISDLHNAQFGRDNSHLASMLKKEKPDLIVVTGDLIDSDEMDASLSFMRKISHIAPCYYVNGNHEAKLGETYELLENELKKMGVHILRNENQKITKGLGNIWITGLDDPDFSKGRSSFAEKVLDENLKKLKPKDNGYQIVLSHRPEVFSVYVSNKCDLVFTGHTHGGQVRLPGLGAIVAPNQGVFPEYDQGVFQQNQTSMIVNRGLGMSVVPIRLNCRPEVVIVDLKTEA